jgi:hypothetical protein
MRGQNPNLDLRFSSPDDFRVRACHYAYLAGKAKSQQMARIRALFDPGTCSTVNRCCIVITIPPLNITDHVGFQEPVVFKIEPVISHYGGAVDLFITIHLSNLLSS